MPDPVKSAVNGIILMAGSVNFGCQDCHRTNYPFTAIDALDNPCNRSSTIGFSIIGMCHNYQDVSIANCLDIALYSL